MARYDYKRLGKDLFIFGEDNESIGDIVDFIVDKEWEKLLIEGSAFSWLAHDPEAKKGMEKAIEHGYLSIYDYNFAVHIKTAYQGLIFDDIYDNFDAVLKDAFDVALREIDYQVKDEKELLKRIVDIEELYIDATINDIRKACKELKDLSL